jgi:hypothetical protein
VLALAREGSRRSQVRPADVAETVRQRFPATAAILAHRTAEVWRDIVKRAFVKELQRYVPAIESKHLAFDRRNPSPAVAADGGMVDDFACYERNQRSRAQCAEPGGYRRPGDSAASQRSGRERLSDDTRR